MFTTACTRVLAAHCEDIPVVGFATVDNENTKVGNTVNYTCDKGFRFPDNSTVMNITCMSSGNWSTNQEDLPQCESMCSVMAFML